MKTITLSLLALSALFLTAAPQLRADFIATASLTPGADGATNSHGSGMATVDYNSAANDFTYTLSWSNLTGSATMAHIHDGAPGVSGPIVVPFFMTTMPASDSISGTLTQSDLTGANGITTISQLATLIESGDAYVNIHTAEYPAGELRGQLAVSSVPEPASLALLGLGALTSAAVLRRRKA